MTRWITHFCAPVFVFLAGVSAYLQTMRGKTTRELSRFLLTRGLWLIAVEIVVLHVLVWFNLDFSFIGPLQVIWAIGWSMIVLAALVHLPRRAIAGFGIAIIALHNLLDGVHVTAWNGPGTPVPSAAAKTWMVLHQAGFTPVLGPSSPLVWVQYPLIPWIGVMAAGYAFGAVYELDRAASRAGSLRRIGLAADRRLRRRFARSTSTATRRPGRCNRAALFTALSFINTTKYPPSLLYLLMTLGPALVALVMVRIAWPNPGGGGSFAADPPRLVTFGRVPLFFYLLQWPLAHGSAIVANVIAGQPFELPVPRRRRRFSAFLGQRLPLVDRVSLLGRHHRDRISALPLVRGREATPPRSVVKLFVGINNETNRFWNPDRALRNHIAACSGARLRARLRRGKPGAIACDRDHHARARRARDTAEAPACARDARRHAGRADTRVSEVAATSDTRVSARPA